MIRFLLLLVLLPGAELFTNITDEAESSTRTSLGAQLNMTASSQTNLQKPSASHGPTNITSVPLPPPLKYGKIHHPVKNSSITPGKVQSSGMISPTESAHINATHNQQRNTTLYVNHWQTTKRPMTTKSHLIGESSPRRLTIKKAPTPSTKMKSAVRSTMKNPSARYQSPPHLHHKNVTAKPGTGHFRYSNTTVGLTEISTRTKPHRTATMPLRNTSKFGQKDIPPAAGKVSHSAMAPHAVTQLNRKLKEKAIGTSGLLNTLTNNNSSSFAIPYHITQSIKEKKTMLEDVNSLNTEEQELRTEDMTLVPLMDMISNISRPGSRIVQGVKSKITDRSIMFNHTKPNWSDPVSSTELFGLTRDERVTFQPILTTQVGLKETERMDTGVTQTERTSDKPIHPDVHSYGHMEAVTPLHTQLRATEHPGVNTQSNIERQDQTLSDPMTHVQIHPHFHRHRHSSTQAENTTLSQHKPASSGRTTGPGEGRHHSKHLHNSTRPHSHKHNEHQVEQQIKTTRSSLADIYLAIEEQLESATLIAPSHPNQPSFQTVPSPHIQKHGKGVKSALSTLSHLGIEQGKHTAHEATTQSITESFTTQPKLNSQSLLNQTTYSQREFTRQTQQVGNSHNESLLAYNPVEQHKLNSLEKESQSNTHIKTDSKTLRHKHPLSLPNYHTKHTIADNVAASTQPELTTQLQPELLTNPQPEVTTHSQSHPTTGTPQAMETNPEQSTQNQPNKSTHSEPEVTKFSQPKQTTQTQRVMETQPDQPLQNLPETTTPIQEGLSRNIWPELSNQSLTGLVRENRLSQVTKSHPLITQNQTLPPTQAPPDHVTLIYVNETQSEPFTGYQSKQNQSRLLTKINFTTRTETNPKTRSPSQTESITESKTGLSTKTEPITKPNTGLSTQTEPTAESKTRLSTQTEPITNPNTGLSTQTEPITESKTGLPTQTEPITNPNTGLSIQTEPITESKTRLPTQNEPVTEPKTGSPTQTEPITKPKTGLPTQTEPITKPKTGLPTNTEPITKDITQLPTKTEPISLSKTRSPTQTETTTGSKSGSSIYTEPISTPKTGSPTHTKPVTEDKTEFLSRTEPTTMLRTVSRTVTGPVTESETTSPTHTKPVTNSVTEFPKQTEPIPKNKTGSPTQTEPITEREAGSHRHTEAVTNIKIGSPTQITPIVDSKSELTTQSDPITKTKTEITTQTEPITKTKTEITTQTEPITKSKTEIATQTEPITKSKTEITTQTEPITKSKTEIATQTEPITKSKTESLTKSESIKNHSSEPANRHTTESTLHSEPVTNEKTEYVTQTEITISNKTHLFTEMGKTGHRWNQTDPMTESSSLADPVTQLVLTTPHYIEYSTHSGQTPAYHMQPPKHHATFTPEVLSVGDSHSTLHEASGHRTEASSPSWNNGSWDSEVTLAGDVETLYPAEGDYSNDLTTTEKSDETETSSSLTSPQSYTSTPQTLGEMMSVKPGKDRIFIVDEQQPVFKVQTINVTHRMNVDHRQACDQPGPCQSRLLQELTSSYQAAPGFDRIQILDVTLLGTAIEYKVLLTVRVGSPMSAAQELVLTNPTLFFGASTSSDKTLLSSIYNASLAGHADPCADWFSCPRDFQCAPRREISALCLSPCHSTFCHNNGICIHRKGGEPECQCPVGRDFWYMGQTCDYRMSHHRLAAIACAVVFCIIICAAAVVFFLVRRFQTQILQQKVAQTQSSYRRFSRFDDVPTHFWCPSQTWLTTSASLNSLDNPAFSSSEEVFPLQALGSCVCGCQDGAQNIPPINPPQPPARAPTRLETSCSSVNDLMIDSGKASDVSVCSWPMEPIHWTPFPILHQLSLQSPFHARRPHSYFEGMELVNTERSWTA